MPNLPRYDSHHIMQSFVYKFKFPNQLSTQFHPNSKQDSSQAINILGICFIECCVYVIRIPLMILRGILSFQSLGSFAYALNTTSAGDQTSLINGLRRFGFDGEICKTALRVRSFPTPQIGRFYGRMEY